MTCADKTEVGRKAMRSLSPSMQELLSKGFSVGDKTRFDKALNALSLDDGTDRKSVV